MILDLGLQAFEFHVSNRTLGFCIDCLNQMPGLLHSFDTISDGLTDVRIFIHWRSSGSGYDT